jgi:hypothetical protein
VFLLVFDTMPVWSVAELLALKRRR